MNPINLNKLNNSISIDLIGSDFDETITQQDTIASLAQLADQVNTHQEGRKPWQYFVDEYLKEYEQVKPKVEENFRQKLTNSNTLLTPEQKFDHLLTYIEQLKSIELNSIDRINRAKWFNNIKQNDIKQFSESTVLRPNFHKVLNSSEVQLFDHFKANWDQFHVLSVNWSKDFIYHSLKGKVQHNHIFSSDFNMDNESGATDGTIQPYMVDGVDKLVQWKKLIEEKKANTTLFIGDSLNDLPCLLSSTYGIIIGNNTKLRKICDLMNIELVTDFKDIDNQPKSKPNFKLINMSEWY